MYLYLLLITEVNYPKSISSIENTWLDAVKIEHVDRDGYWSEWTSYSPCTVSSDELCSSNGYRTRQRTCYKSNRGKECKNFSNKGNISTEKISCHQEFKYWCAIEDPKKNRANFDLLRIEDSNCVEDILPLVKDLYPSNTKMISSMKLEDIVKSFPHPSNYYSESWISLSPYGDDVTIMHTFVDLSEIMDAFGVNSDQKKSITIIADTIYVEKNIVFNDLENFNIHCNIMLISHGVDYINFKQRAGIDGNNTRDQRGNDGKPGENGTDGKNGTVVNINVSEMLLIESENLEIRTEGGNGGNGGDGSSGMPGRDSSGVPEDKRQEIIKKWEDSDWSNKFGSKNHGGHDKQGTYYGSSHYWWCRNNNQNDICTWRKDPECFDRIQAPKGGDGGNGGDGGKGGNGGNSGFINIKQNGMYGLGDILMVRISGNGGTSGNEGDGKPGGRGSYSTRGVKCDGNKG